MILRKMVLIAAAASGFAGLAAGEAAAKPFFLFRPFLPGYNDSYPPPDDVYYMDEEEYYRYLKRQRRKQRMIDEYYANQGAYDDYQDGYAEDYVPPRRQRKKQAVAPLEPKPAVKAKKKTAASAPVKAKKPASQKKLEQQPRTTASAKPPVRNQSTASVSKPSAPAVSGSSMSCNKAADIVAGYGFDSVKAGSCSGAVYSFNAVRSGKSYLVRVNSASGELTEVKKL